MLELEVARLLHRRLGYEQIVSEQVPEAVYLNEEGQLFSAPLSDNASKLPRFKLTDSDARGATYSLVLHDCELAFSAHHRDETVTLAENGPLSPADEALLKKVLHHLQTASRRTLVRKPTSSRLLWRRLLVRKRLAEPAR